MTKYNIKVIPKSSQNKIIDETNNSLKIKLRVAPEKGKANNELIKILAKHFRISKSNIKIIKGQTNKNKIIEINE